MTDFIVRYPYTFRDERLFPPGWRSFSNVIYSLNHIEVTRSYTGVNGLEGEITTSVIALNDLVSEDPNVEIVSVNDLAGDIISIISKNQLEVSSSFISLNGIEGEITSSVISLNDLAHIVVDVISVNRFEVSEEIISINNIESPVEREYVGLNVLSSPFILPIISLIDIFENEIATLDITSLNDLEDDVSYTAQSHVIHVYVDDTLVDGLIEKWSLTMSESSYVNQATVTFASQAFYANCNPMTRIGERRISIYIDDIRYRFMLEKREPSRNPKDVSFTIWGRSYIATLGEPYTIPVIDKEVVYDSVTDTWSCPDDENYVPHIWQIRDCMVSEIMEALIGSDHTLLFQINDFVVYKGSLVVSNESPIAVVDKLAQIVGGTVRTDLADRVIVKYISFSTAGTNVAEFSGLDNIYVLSESLKYPTGKNRVLVRGYEDPIVEASTNIKLELDEDLNEEKTTFVFGDEIWIRLYRSPFTVDYEIECSLGSFTISSAEVAQTITRESSGFGGKTLTTAYPIDSVTLIERYNCTNIPSSEYSYVSGYNIVNSEGTIEDEPVLISYTSKYALYKLVVNRPCDPLIFTEVLSQITAKQT